VEIEERVEVWEECVSNEESGLRRLGHFGSESPRILLHIPNSIVIPGEGIESPEFHPSLTHLGIRVPIEPADVGT
jgi:hypothetical protein